MTRQAQYASKRQGTAGKAKLSAAFTYKKIIHIRIMIKM